MLVPPSHSAAWYSTVLPPNTAASGVEDAQCNDGSTALTCSRWVGAVSSTTELDNVKLSITEGPALSLTTAVTGTGEPADGTTTAGKSEVMPGECSHSEADFLKTWPVPEYPGGYSLASSSQDAATAGNTPTINVFTVPDVRMGFCDQFPVTSTRKGAVSEENSVVYAVGVTTVSTSPRMVQKFHD